ncbi:MAG TPA: hypothetical protein PK926_16975 [Spirochaetota bacterium]|nr:hypothetical protein [Spirochaetota bacterium]HPR49376.1 hypothetical protein [Spirochaetota bacterium]
MNSTTFGAITRNLGEEFAGKISYASYGAGSTYTPAINRSGEFNEINKIDCVGLVSTSIHILNMSDITRSDGTVVSANANDYEGTDWSFDPLRDSAGKRPGIITDTRTTYFMGIIPTGTDDYQRFDEGRINGVTNMLYNNSLFDRFDASRYDGDYTGLIGVTERTRTLGDDSRTWYDHVYVQTDSNEDGSIVESCGGRGVRNDTSNDYINKTKYYLRLKLSENRMF